MKWFRPHTPVPTRNILDLVSASNVQVYHTLSDRAEELERGISVMTEELRQCRVAMETTSAALTFVGVDPSLALERTLSINAIVDSAFAGHLELEMAAHI